MGLDGTRAFIVGDYVTPSAGSHAGQLGPWSDLLNAVGIDPRSTFAKALHIVSALLWLGAIASLAGRNRSAQRVLAIAAGTGSLWYLPFGTIGGVVTFLLLLTEESGPP
jgi:hypothetical protein